MGLDVLTMVLLGELGLGGIQWGTDMFYFLISVLIMHTFSLSDNSPSCSLMISGFSLCILHFKLKKIDILFFQLDETSMP